MIVAGGGLHDEVRGRADSSVASEYIYLYTFLLLLELFWKVDLAVFQNSGKLCQLPGSL